MTNNDTPNADTVEAIAEVEAMKNDPHKKTYSSFAEIIAEAYAEMGECVSTKFSKLDVSKRI